MSVKNETELNVHFRHTNTDPAPSRKGMRKFSGCKQLCVIALVLIILIALLAVIHFLFPGLSFSGSATVKAG